MAMQEFLASYAVKVDEDGARRLQAILERNRESGAALASVFSSARSALAALKKELSESVNLKNVFSSLNTGGGSAGTAGEASSGFSGSSGRGTATSGSLSSASGFSAGSSVLSVGANFAAAEEALQAFTSRMESERPMLSVNTSGINSAVSSAVATVRSMLNSVNVTVPVTAEVSLDLSGIGGSGFTISGGGSGGGKSGGTGSSGKSSSSGTKGSVINLARFGSGGRVDSPTLAMIAEEGKPEYVIPTEDEERAVQLLRGLMTELSESAKAAVFRYTGKGQEEYKVGFGSSKDSETGFRSSPAFMHEMKQITGLRSDSNKRESSATGTTSGNAASPAFDFAANISSAIDSLRSVARESFLPVGANAAPSVQTVQAPVNIQVTSSAAAPEAVARTVYDTAQRSLLKTLKGVFV